MDDHCTYQDVRAAGPVAAELRAEARRVAQRLTAHVPADGGGPYAWPLWENSAFHNGEALSKEPSPGFAWWQSSAELALGSDGRLLFVETPLPAQEVNRFRRTHPLNHTLTETPREAADAELFYPDALSWRMHEHVEHAPARDIFERQAAPERYRRDLGSGLRTALGQLEHHPGPPARIGVPAAPQPARVAAGAGEHRSRADFDQLRQATAAAAVLLAGDVLVLAGILARSVPLGLAGVALALGSLPFVARWNFVARRPTVDRAAAVALLLLTLWPAFGAIFPIFALLSFPAQRRAVHNTQ